MKKNNFILTTVIISTMVNQYTHTEGYLSRFHDSNRSAMIMNTQPQLPPQFINVADVDFIDEATAGPSMFDTLIAAGIKNQNIGWKNLLPVIDASELQSSNYPVYQATTSITRMAYGTGQVLAGDVLKLAYNNPNEAMSCVTIPAMMGIVMYDSYQRKQSGNF